MLRMSREADDSDGNYRENQWPVDAKLMGPTRIAIRDIEQSATEAYHQLTGELLQLPDHLKP